MKKSFEEWFQIVKNRGLKFVTSTSNSEYDLMMDWQEEREKYRNIIDRQDVYISKIEKELYKIIKFCHETIEDCEKFKNFERISLHAMQKDKVVKP